MSLLRLQVILSEKTMEGQYLCWDKLPSAGCPLSLSNQDPQSCICCFLLPLLLVGCTHWREPASTQLGLVGEPEQVEQRERQQVKIRQDFFFHSL